MNGILGTQTLKNFKFCFHRVCMCARVCVLFWISGMPNNIPFMLCLSSTAKGPNLNDKGYGQLDIF